MNLTVRHLQMLVAAADLGSFSKAAEQMSISQPAFSGAIRKIEEEVGCRLFNRTTRALKLTGDGRRIVETARELVRDFKFALESIRGDAGAKERISVAALPSIVAAVMPTALKRLSERFPDIKVAVHDVPQERAVAMVQDGLVDIGILMPTPDAEGLRFTEIGSDRFYAMLPANHRLRTGVQVRWKELAEFPFIALTGLSSIRRVTDAAFINADAGPKVRCEVEHILSAVALVEGEYGVTALPSIACTIFRDRRVVMRPIVDPVGHRRLAIVTLPHRHLSTVGRYMTSVLEDSVRAVLSESLSL